ncbi:MULTISPECIES: hypothetical protein [unclassified Streptomyces]|uniref:hypothetical protein n=1 Tax=unclassified Streptomyces TaxID=2593676 RepID=UPI0037AF770D
MAITLLAAAQSPALSAPGNSGRPPDPSAGNAGQSSSRRQEAPTETTEPLPEAAKQSFKSQKEADQKPQEVKERPPSIERGYSCDEFVWCEGGTNIVQVTRFSICSVRYWYVIVYKTDGSKFGTADITTSQEINTAPRATELTEDFSMRIDRMDPFMASVLVSVDTECNYLTGCHDDGQDPWTGALTLPPVGTSAGTTRSRCTGCRRGDHGAHTETRMSMPTTPHIHSQLNSDGTHFAFSYNVNSFDSGTSEQSTHYRYPSIYKPRWVPFTARPNTCPPRC